MPLVQKVGFIDISPEILTEYLKSLELESVAVSDEVYAFISDAVEVSMFDTRSIVFNRLISAVAVKEKTQSLSNINTRISIAIDGSDKCADWETDQIKYYFFNAKVELNCLFFSFPVTAEADIFQHLKHQS